MKVTYNNPQLPKGEELAIVGLGLIENGGSIEVTSEQEAEFEATTGRTLQEAAKDDEMLSVGGTTRKPKE